MNKRLLGLLAFFGILAAVTAGQNVHIHMLRASRTDDSMDKKLEDVSAFLRQSLPFYQGFALLKKQQVAAPGTGDVVLLFGYKLTYESTPEAFSLVIFRDADELLRHRVVLKPGKPHLIGPFPDPEKKGDILFLLVHRAVE